MTQSSVAISSLYHSWVYQSDPPPESPPLPDKKYILSWSCLEDVNTFADSGTHQIEVLDNLQEVKDYLKWCSLSERSPSLDHYLSKNTIYLYEIPKGVHLKTSKDIK